MRSALLLVAAVLGSPFVVARADDRPKEWEFTGQTRSASVDVMARLTGYLTRIVVREGDQVEKGDLLAELDARWNQLDLDAAEARVKVAEAKLQRAKITSGDSKKLVDKNVIGRDELALNKAAEAEAEGALMAAKVDVERAKLNLSWTKITAPSDGRVSHIEVTEGSLATADKTRLMTVVSSEPLSVSFDVPELVLLQMRRDGLSEPDRFDVSVGFAIDNGHPHAAKLNAIEPELDPKTKMAHFRATLKNPKGLLSPGMTARVRLTPKARS